MLKCPIFLAGLFSAVWLSAPHVRAQSCPSGSTCFYVPPAMVHAGGSDAYDNELWLSVPTGTATGTYSVDGATGVAFNVTSTAALKVALAAKTMSSAVNVPEARGVFVVSSREDLLVEHKELRLASSSYTEGYSVTAPRHTVALGTRFRLGAFRMTQASPLGSVAPTAQWAMVTAPTAATVTLSAPPGATLPYWTGSTTATHSVTLAAGQSVSVSANASLDGALLTATAPVAAASGGRGWLSPCGDNGADVLVPTSQYGTEWAVLLPSGSPAGAGVAVIADVDMTEVRVNGTVVATLSAGQTHFFTPSGPTRIQTSTPSLVWMNGALNACELDTALIPPLQLPVAPLTITFNASFAAQVVVVVGTSSAASLQVDGAAATPTSSSTLPGKPDTTVIVLNVAAGLHTVSASSGFQLMAAYAGAGAGVLAYFGPFTACTATASCPDVGPCFVEQCVTGACTATAVPVGTQGGCASGLVCDASGKCVTPSDAGPSDAGTSDAGTSDAGDAGPSDASSGGTGGTAGAGGGAGSGGTVATGATGGTAAGGMDGGAGAGGTSPGTAGKSGADSGDDGGCGCKVPGRDTTSHRAAWLLAIALAFAAARRKR